MLEPLLHKLNVKRIVLGSASPRRNEILRNAGLNFEIIPSSFEENLDKSKFSSPLDYALTNAVNKARSVEDICRTDGRSIPDLIIGCDCIVTLHSVIFEKPKTAEKAKRMLEALSGGEHQVHTGVALLYKNKAQTGDEFLLRKFVETTFVKFGVLTPDVIEAYIATGEPLEDFNELRSLVIYGSTRKAVFKSGYIL